MARHIVALAEEIPPGQRKVVSVAGRDVVVFNSSGEFFAVANTCPHRGAPLSRGKITGFVNSSGRGDYQFSKAGEVLRCPWHGWEFDLRTGQSYCDPKRIRARHFPATVEAGATLVEGPYVAETYKVEVDGKYVVLEA
jgi:nitrite reductase/ring-hydroxylating ferredoxin subunit